MCRDYIISYCLIVCIQLVKSAIDIIYIAMIAQALILF